MYCKALQSSGLLKSATRTGKNLSSHQRGGMASHKSSSSNSFGAYIECRHLKQCPDGESKAPKVVGVVLAKEVMAGEPVGEEHHKEEERGVEQRLRSMGYPRLWTGGEAGQGHMNRICAKGVLDSQWK